MANYPLLLLLLIFLFPFSTTSLTFNFSTFPPDVATNISMEGDASADGALRLTKSALDQVLSLSFGRATYRDSLLLREASTGKLADFTSTFTFVIDSDNSSRFGDGLAFFLAPVGSKLNTSGDQGRSLGLPVNTSQLDYTKWPVAYPFVAIEFDIFPNIVVDFGVNYTHVGIDINTVRSNVTEPWIGGIMTGNENNATISYNSSSKNFSATFTTLENGVTVMRNIHLTVDLLTYLPDEVIVGFSAATGTQTALHKINTWRFRSTELVNENNVSSKKKGKNVGLIVGVVVGGIFVLVGGLCLVWFSLCRRRKKEEANGESSDDEALRDLNPEDFEKGTGPRKFTYNELANATSNFAQEEKLGEGGFGGVYRGFIKDLNSYVAVKKISRGSKQGLKEYAAEVSIISRLRHRNLVQLIGWCYDKKLLLVYEYMPNGSLDAHLFKQRSLLTWDARYKIAHGLASGLLYLHQGWEQCVLHRDIKSSNVMLDANFNAKLGDFGLARLVDHGKLSQTTVVAGTMGYMASEYITSGKASMETDVYSFGVVCLEIACGRKPIDTRYEEKQIDMVNWVWQLYGEGKINEAGDPKLCGEFDEKEMECLLMVGLWCAHPDHNCRPLMQQAIQVLDFEISLPNLPLKMPVAFAAPQLSLSLAYKDSVISTSGDQVESSGFGSTINSSQFNSSSTTNSIPSGASKQVI